MFSKSEAKYIQSLSQKKFRDLHRQFIIEGPKIVREALASTTPSVKKIYAVKEWIDNHKENTQHIEVIEINQAQLESISQLKSPNQVVAVAAIPEMVGLQVANDAMALALDGIQDPGNLGTIIRIADWFGIQQIICSQDCADAFNPKVVQATMGSIFRVALLYTNLADWLKQNNGTAVYGALLNGTPLKNVKQVRGGIVVIGNESKGIRAEVMPYIHQEITIEKLGQAESLNAAVAAGIILSHLK